MTDIICAECTNPTSQASGQSESSKSPIFGTMNELYLHMSKEHNKQAGPIVYDSMGNVVAKTTDGPAMRDIPEPQGKPNYGAPVAETNDSPTPDNPNPGTENTVEAFIRSRKPIYPKDVGSDEESAAMGRAMKTQAVLDWQVEDDLWKRTAKVIAANINRFTDIDRNEWKDKVRIARVVLDRAQHGLDILLVNEPPAKPENIGAFWDRNMRIIVDGG